MFTEAKIIVFTFFLIGTFSLTNAQEEKNTYYISKGKIDYKLNSEEELFLDSLQRCSFGFFINEINPANGLVKDRTASWSASSIAAIGFAIPTYAVGAERGWITRAEAAHLVSTILNFFLNSNQDGDTSSTGYKGFYYHFLKMKTGARDYHSELSTIDTGFLISGIIFARQYFNADDPVENVIRQTADKIVERLDWNFFRMKTNNKYNNSICMGWDSETKKFHDMGWTGYNEAIILYILAAGGNLENPNESYAAWLKSYTWNEPYPGFAHAIFPPMFGHQYSHMFIDFRGLADDYMKEAGIDYFENSRNAVYTQRKYAIENPNCWIGYDSLTWGITACDGPGENYNFDGKKFYTYAGRGTSGPDLVYFDDGTIAPTAAGGSIVFAPEICLPALMNMNKLYSNKGLWSTYGMLDSFNPTLNWFNKEYIGIDEGPIVLMIENLRSGLVWNYFMKDSLIQKGLKVLGFDYLQNK